MHGCVVVVAVCVASRVGVPGRDSCVRVSVACLDVLSCSGWVRPALSLWCSLVVLPRVSECACMGGGPSRSLSCLL